MIETNGVSSDAVKYGKAATRPLILGRYIVADPRICHGKPTFRGTRIFVSDVLEQIAEGMDWESIAESWGNRISREAIAEVADLARRAFLNHFEEFEIEPLAV